MLRNHEFYPIGFSMNNEICDSQSQNYTFEAKCRIEFEYRMINLMKIT